MDGKTEKLNNIITTLLRAFVKYFVIKIFAFRAILDKNIAIGSIKIATVVLDCYDTPKILILVFIELRENQE